MPTVSISPISGALVVREFVGRVAVRSVAGKATLLRCTHHIAGLPVGAAPKVEVELMSVSELDKTEVNIEQIGAGHATWIGDETATEKAFPFTLSLTAYLTESAFNLLWSSLNRDVPKSIVVDFEVGGSQNNSQRWDLLPNEFQRIASVTVYAKFGLPSAS